MPQQYKILITGSSGMLGADLFQELGAGFDLYGMDIAESRNPAAESRKYFKCDISERRKVAKIISGIRPDAVIHCAAWTDVDGCELDKKNAYKINSAGTENTAVACKKTDAVFIYVSTDFVFDGRKKGPYSEIDRPRPLSAYGDSKLKGEEAVKKTLARFFILRTSWLYGKHGKNFVDTILAKSKSKKTIAVVDDQIGSPTCTKDLAKAIHKLVDTFRLEPEGSKAYGVYHISNSGRVSWYEYARQIVRLAKLKTVIVPISSKELARPARRPAMSVLNNSKFAKFTGYKMRHWRSALREYLLAINASA